VPNRTGVAVTFVSRARAAVAPRAPIGLKWAKTKGKLAMGASALGREHDHM
jgi:hypothetical protein